MEPKLREFFRAASCGEFRESVYEHMYVYVCADCLSAINVQESLRVIGTIILTSN